MASAQQTSTAVRSERRAMLGVASVILGVGAALLFFVCYAGLTMNRAARASDLALIASALDDVVDRTLMEQKSIAFWGEAVTQVNAPAPDLAWMDREIGAYLTEGYGHDEIFVLDAAGRVRYGYGGATRLAPGAFGQIGPSVKPMIAELRGGEPRGYTIRDGQFAHSQQRYDLGNPLRTARWAGNLIQTPNGPAIVTVLNMVGPTSAATEPRSALVSVVHVDNEFLSQLGRTLKLGTLRLDTRLTDLDEALLRSDDGKPLGRLTWRTRSPGMMLLTRVLPVMVIVLAGAAIYVRMIFKRLSSAYRRLEEQEAHARFLSLHDPLSGLPNRRQFMAELERRLSANGDGEAAICVAYMDVDRFKEVNDVVGHGAGDELVAQIGPRVAKLLGPGDLLARIGGDEFAVIHALEPGRTPEALGDTLLSAFAEPFTVGSGALGVTTSIGLARGCSGTSADALLKDADISLYRAKDDGRARYVVFVESMAEEARERHEIEAELRAAIGTKALAMHYQPIFSVRSGAVTGFEALVRWKHPSLGNVSPGRFIPIAERCGLMTPLGEDILRRVMKDAASLPNVDVAVNLSPIQLRDRALPQLLEGLAEQHRVDPRRIVLEVTETTLIDADQVVDQVFADLVARGFRIALDDFGTGYSSLSYLQRFEFAKIKIDRSFVRAQSIERQRPIIQAVVTIGRGYDMEIIAEGVETAAEFATVQSLGCTAVQGFWLSKPMPFGEAKTFLKRKAAAGAAGTDYSPLEFDDTEAVARPERLAS